MAPTGTVMDKLCRVRKTVQALHPEPRPNAETELIVSACTGAARARIMVVLQNGFNLPSGAVGTHLSKLQSELCKYTGRSSAWKH